MGPHTPVRRDHRAKESGPRAHGNNRQFLSVAPNAILTPRAHGITDTSAFRTNAGPIFPPPQWPSAAAPATDPKIKPGTGERHYRLGLL